MATKKKALEKLDFRKSLKPLYTASPQTTEVRVERGTFLSIDGQGAPGGPAFQQAIEKLYSVAYTLKFMLKGAGRLDFGVPCLECLYTSCDSSRESWAWTLQLRIPDAVRAGDVTTARAEVKRRRNLDTAGVKRRAWREGRCLQTLHVGPYAEVGPVYERLAGHATQLGLAVGGAAHEVYISDPRRVPPARLRTIVRLPVTPARRRAWPLTSSNSRRATSPSRRR